MGRGRAGADLRSTTRRGPVWVTGAAGLIAAFLLGGLFGVVPLGTAPVGAAASHPATTTDTVVKVALRHPAATLVAGSGRAVGSQPHDIAIPVCTFNGATEIVPGVTPGAAISVVCSGWEPSDEIEATEFSPLLITSGSAADLDSADEQSFEADASGELAATFIVPDPFTAPDPVAACPPTPTQVDEGYLRCGIVMADADGNGTVVALDYAGVTLPTQPASTMGPPPPVGARAVGIASAAYGGGYWLAWSDGTVTDYGDALDFGDASALSLNEPITHIVATPDGLGYWLVAADGGVFTFGDAGFYGSMGGLYLNRPVVDMAPTPDGLGYWLVASDGGVFSFGDASFYGSMGGKPLNQPVVGMAADTATGGYWLVAADGGVFSFNAPFLGSTGGRVLNRPVVVIVGVPGGGGYFFVASDGGVFTYGDALFAGSTGGMLLAAPIVGGTFDPLTGGYWLAGADGGVFAFDAPFDGSG